MSDTTFTGDVVPSVSIENLVNQRNAVVERLRAALALIWEAQDIASHSRVGMPRLVQEICGRGTSLWELKLYRQHRRITDPLDEDEDQHDEHIDQTAVLSRIEKEVDALAWQRLMSDSGMKTFMDTETRNEWDIKIYKREFPPLTLENIEATFVGLHLNRQCMLEDGVIRCFQRLSWCYKTNKPFKFGPRIILRGFSEYDYKRCNELDDLVRVFHVLDGIPEPDHRNGMYRAVAAAYREKGWPKICDTRYLRIRLFKNRNAHITFKREDLVERMNLMLARRYPAALPYDRRAD